MAIPVVFIPGPPSITLHYFPPSSNKHFYFLLQITDCLSLSDSDDWSLRHGRSTALFVALKDSPDRVYADANQAKTVKVILALLKVSASKIIFHDVISYIT